MYPIQGKCCSCLCHLCMLSIVRLDESAEAEVLLNDNVINGGHDEADLGGIGGTGEMCVNLLRLVLVQADESVQDVVAGLGVIISSFIIREIVLHWADWKLLLETIDLVQEQDY